MLSFFKKMILAEENSKIETKIASQMKAYISIETLATGDRDDTAFILNQALTLARDVVSLGHGEEVVPDRMNNPQDKVKWCKQRQKFFNVPKTSNTF